KLYAAAAQLCGDVFSADPKRAEDVPGGARYYAACAAALAGCGQGKDAGRLDDKERARWRRQALDWLRQGVTWWGKALGNGDAQTNARARERLRHWQQDRDLAGLRDVAALARLPPEERAACEKLLTDVAELLTKAEEKTK